MDDGMSQEHQKLLAGRQRRERQALLDQALGATPEPVWCPVANVVQERRHGPGGEALKRGTKHFAPCAKVYSLPPLWDIGWDGAQLMVVGRHRATHRYVAMVIAAKWLRNWRVELIYSPHVIREMAWQRLQRYRGLPEVTIAYMREHKMLWDGDEEGKERAQAFVDMMLQIFPHSAPGSPG